MKSNDSVVKYETQFFLSWLKAQHLSSVWLDGFFLDAFVSVDAKLMMCWTKLKLILKLIPRFPQVIILSENHLMTEIFKLEPNKKFPFYTLYTGNR